MRKLTTLLALCLLCSSVMSQPIYQWTDERGVVQFGQLPPVNTPYRQLDIRAPAPIGGELRAPAPLPAAPSKEDTDRQRRQQQAIAEAAELNRAYCEQIQQDLTTMQNNPRLRRTNADGEVERIGEDERQQLIQQRQKELHTHCQ